MLRNRSSNFVNEGSNECHAEANSLEKPIGATDVTHWGCLPVQIEYCKAIRLCVESRNNPAFQLGIMRTSEFSTVGGT